jgi:hypothetical protein
MSLIERRRERRVGFGGPKGRPKTWKLVLGLLLVLYMIWYLGRYT